MRVNATTGEIVGGDFVLKLERGDQFYLHVYVSLIHAKATNSDSNEIQLTLHCLQVHSQLSMLFFRAAWKV